MQNPPPIRIGGQFTKSPYQLTLQGPTPKEIYYWAPQIEAKMRGLPGLQDVNSDLQLTSPAGVCGHRTATEPCPWGLAGADAGRALHRVWQPPGLHHLHARQ